MRETAVFFDEMRERLNRHPGDLPNAVQAAVATSSRRPAAIPRCRPS